MQLTMPNIELPWRRKTQLERTQAELQRVQKDLEKQVDKIDLPRIELPKAEDISAVVDDTRRAVGSGVEQVAVVVGQLGREAGKLGRKAGRKGRSLGGELVKAGDENLKHLGADLKDLGSEVRSLRVTSEKRGPDIMPGIALLAGLGSGLAAMYFFDPEQGRRRRALLRDQLTKWTRVAGESVGGKVQDLRNRSAGLAHEVRRGIESDGDSAELALDDLADSTPDSAQELASTDQELASTDQAAEDPLAPAASGAWAEDLTVPEGGEAQPDLGRPH
ncbi:hypothetical protein BH24CHL6_BH24CHL6_09790 [soil metagenome]